jgi:hypothetical protein
MKKLLLAVVLFIMCNGVLNAQTPQAAAKQKPPVTKAAGPLKKDGTPDKRYKSNKVPTKKDGTPDMRYKVNQKN